MYSSIWSVLQSPWSVSILPDLSTNKQDVFSKLARVFMVSAEEPCGGAPLSGNITSRPLKVVVGGGSGFVGGEVCRQLRRAGYEVIVISRVQREHGVTWEEVEKEGLPKGTHGVVNLAGQNVLDPLRRWSPSFKELCRTSRVDSTSLLARVMDKSVNKPEVFVQVSGVGYYPNTDMEKVMDESGEQGKDWLAKLAGEWEQAGVVKGVRRVVLRPGVVLGREGGMVKQIFLPFYLGLGGRMGEGSQPLPWIHVKDLAGLVVHSVKNNQAEGVLNAVAPQIISNNEFVSAFAGALWRPAVFPLPEFVWNFVFGEERAVMITRGQKVVPRRTLESGYKFMYPTIESACNEFSHLVYVNSDPDL